MTSLLDLPLVLVLNRLWQPVGVRSPADAFCQLANGAATALDVAADSVRPVTWTEWLALPVREQDRSVRTVRGGIRIPTVIIAVRFSRVPKRRPAFNGRTLRERDGNRCQYTGRLLGPEEGSIDHIIPRSRGGTDSWDNCVWADRKVNQRKGNRLPQEAGLQLIRPPVVPPELPVSAWIRNAHGIPEWEYFLTG